MERKLKWCFKIKDGAKLVQPSKIISGSYLTLAKDSLKSAELMLKEKDILWTTIITYYAEYYVLSSFLSMVGIKCENHFCSILISQFLLSKEKIKTIEKHREMRIDAQYYLRVSEERKVKDMLNSAKIFVAGLEDVISNLNEEKINFFRNEIINSLRR